MESSQEQTERRALTRERWEANKDTTNKKGGSIDQKKHQNKANAVALLSAYTSYSSEKNQEEEKISALT